MGAKGQLCLKEAVGGYGERDTANMLHRSKEESWRINYTALTLLLISSLLLLLPIGTIQTEARRDGSLLMPSFETFLLEHSLACKWPSLGTVSARVPSLVQELSSCKPRGMAKKKKRKTVDKTLFLVTEQLEKDLEEQAENTQEGLAAGLCIAVKGRADTGTGRRADRTSPQGSQYDVQTKQPARLLRSTSQTRAADR